MKTPGKKSAARKSSPKKRSRVKNDTLKAFQLVCLLIAVSICVSFAIIIIRNNSIRGRQEIPSAHIDASPVSAPIESAPPPAPLPAPEPSRPPEQTPAPLPVPALEITSTSNRNVAPVIPPLPSARQTEHKGNIAFVIDDAGNNLQELEPFLRIEGPLTIAVLPGLPYSREAARRIRTAGKEVILHQPMEAVGAQNPGPGAIYSGMNVEQIRSTLKKNIEEVGPVAGINNHQGSKITMDRGIMEVILAFCAENNLYFLDSRTTAETAVPAAARRLGMKIAERDTFLDNEQDKESIQRYLASGLARAQRNGTSVMIGHTHSPALAPLLAAQYPDLTIQGYTIKTVSDILK